MRKVKRLSDYFLSEREWISGVSSNILQSQMFLPKETDDQLKQKKHQKNHDKIHNNSKDFNIKINSEKHFTETCNLEAIQIKNIDSILNKDSREIIQYKRTEKTANSEEIFLKSKLSFKNYKKRNIYLGENVSMNTLNEMAAGNV